MSAVMEQEVQSMQIRKEMQINAPIDVTFEALLEEMGPGSQMPDGTSLSLKIEPWPGGRWYRDLGNNAGHLWGHVQVIKPPTLLEFCGPMAMSYPALNHIQYRLKEEGGKTTLSFLHTSMGMILPQHREGMPKGWEGWLTRVREAAERKGKMTGARG